MSEEWRLLDFYVDLNETTEGKEKPAVLLTFKYFEFSVKTFCKF